MKKSRLKIHFADELSEKIYFNLLNISEKEDLRYLSKAIKLSGIDPDPAYQWYMDLKEMENNGVQLILYGLGETARTIWQTELDRRGTPGYLHFPFLGDIDWFGVCDKNTDQFPNGFLGKKVMSVDELLLLKEKNICVCIGAPDYYEEIEKELIELGIKKSKSYDIYIPKQFVMRINNILMISWKSKGKVQ